MSMQSQTVLAKSTESRKYTTTETINSLAASDSNELIVIGGNAPDGKGVFHALGPSGELKWSQPYPKRVSVVAISGKGNFVGMGGEAKTAYMFTGFGQLVWNDDCRSEVKALAISATGRYAVFGLADGNIIVYDNDTVAARKFAWKHRFGKPITEVGLNADGTLVCASTEEGEFSVFTEKGDLVWSKVLETGIGSFRIAGEGDAIVVASEDGKIRCYSAEVGKVLWTAQGGGVFNDVDITRKADKIVAACKDGNIYCFDKAGAVLWKYAMGNPGENVRIAKDGKTVVASSIDAVIHCLDAKGNLLWKHATGSSCVVGIVVSESGDMIVTSCESGLLYFENIQVVGGLLPIARHEVTLAKERGISTFKAEKLYEEAVVALNFGDYITAAGKIREMEKVLGPAPKPMPSPDAIVKPGTPLAAKPSDEVQKVRTRIDLILNETEALKKRGVDVEPVENLLGEAMVLLEEGNCQDSDAYVQDASEMLDTIKAEAPPAPTPPPKPVAAVPPKAKNDAMEAVEKAAKMLSELEDTELSLDTVRSDIKNAKDLIVAADYQRAITAANRAVVTMEKALDPYITECLVDVQKLLKGAEKEGIDITVPKNDLSKVRSQIKAQNFLGALDTVTGVEEWLEDALEAKKKAPPAKPVDAKPDGLDALKAEISKPKKPDEPAKPAFDVSKMPQGKVDPQKALVDADAALKAGNIAAAVELYLQVAETAEGMARSIVEETVNKAKEQVAKVQKDGFDVAEATALIEGATTDLNAGNYSGAVPKAMQAFEKADTAAAVEIQKIIEETRKALEMAQKIGANIQAAEDLINNAEAAMKKREYKVAIELSDKGVAEIEKSSNATVGKILEEGKIFLDKAAAMGVNVKTVKAQFDEARTALDSRVFIKAHELAKKAVEAAKEIPKKFVQDKLTEARNKVVVVEKIGADTMMAKNHLIRARSLLAANDFEAALKSLEKCVQETSKAPRDLVAKRMATARADIEDVKAMGQATTDVEGIIAQAEAKKVEEKFDEAMTLVDQALVTLKHIKELGTQATNAIFDADMAISIARDAGKDVTKANELMHEALEVRAKDPGKAKDMALAIKKMVE
jgi:outer membrane protein assembly factor BamB/tetratricopeptide (TPR) repeat protein